MIYNFRFDRGRKKEILKRLKSDRVLSQGWGGGKECIPLTDDLNTIRAKIKERYDLKTTRIPTNLSKIKGFKDGDILITPHLPSEKKFSIHIVDGDFPNCYSCKESDMTNMNHRIKIKKSYGLDGNLSLYNSEVATWKGKLQWMRLPILPINQYKNEFAVLISELSKDPKIEYKKSDLSEYLEKVQSETLKFIKTRLQEINPSNDVISFESICETVLANQGYKIVNRNFYDGAGGDADLVCEKDRSNISPFEQGQDILYVQIKKHKGTTNEGAIDQLLKMIEKNENAKGCVITLADNFTKEAINIADEEGIVLMDGNTISELLMAVMIDQV